MPTLQEAKSDRYRKNRRWIIQRWKDAKSYVSAGDGPRVKDERLFRAVARSSDTSTDYVRQVYHGHDTSERILKHLHAAVMGLRENLGVPEWL